MTAAQQESTTNYWHVSKKKNQQHFTIFKYDLQINPGWKPLAEVLKLSHNTICITLQPFFLPPSKASRFHDLVVVLVSGSRGPLVKHSYSLCTGKTTQKAGLRCSFQAAAVSSLEAIRRTLKKKPINIYRRLKISYSFKQTGWQKCLSVMDV